MKKTSKKHKSFLPFQKARQIIRKLKIPCIAKWWVYASSQRPSYIPAAPHRIYKKEWRGWSDFLGSGNKIGGIKKYNVNENYFKKWSNDMAYILGLWWTDGNIHGSRFHISQNKKDKVILEKILKEIKSNHLINFDKRSNLARIDIYSKTIVKDIQKIGGCEKKSKIAKMPNVPKKYLASFINGLWDGDGSIWFGKDKNAYLSNFTSGSKIFIYEFHSLLKRNISDLRGKIRIRKTHKGFKIQGVPFKNNTITYQLYFGTNDTKRISKFILLGKNKLKLQRKYVQFKNAGESRIISHEENIEH